MISKLNYKTTFIKKVLPGSIIVSGKVIKSGKTIAFLEGTILDEKNNILAKANQTVKLIPNFYNKNK